MTRRRGIAPAGALLVAVAVAVAVAGCGITTQQAREAAIRVRTSTTAAATLPTFPALSNRPPGQLIVDGSIGQLTARAYADYHRQGGAGTVKVRNDSDATAFAKLCSGRIDVVDSSRAITPAEVKRCTAQRVRPIELEFGSQAIVLATRAGTDTGADCLSVAQVRTIVRAGSPDTSWSRLGDDDLPLNLAGAGPRSPVFNFLSRYVLGDQPPALLNFRYDYAAERNDDGTLDFVVGTPAEQAAGAALPVDIRRLESVRRLLSGQRKTLSSATKWVAQASAQVTTGIDDGWPYTERLLNEDKLQAAQTKYTGAQAQVTKLTGELTRLTRRLKRERATLVRRRALAGNLGAFPYSFYALYQQQLRPLEISATQNPQNCIFPSNETVSSGAYPLARQMLLTTTLNELDQNTYLREFLLSYLENAARLSPQSAVQPVPANIMSKEENFLEGNPSSPTRATIASSGSTQG